MLGGGKIMFTKKEAVWLHWHYIGDKCVEPNKKGRELLDQYNRVGHLYTVYFGGSKDKYD
jgi:hypothetical protein